MYASRKNVRLNERKQLGDHSHAYYIVAFYDVGVERPSAASYRYIVRSAEVRDGHARVNGTRVAVHDVIGLLQTGETVDSVISSCLPMLTKAQVYECLAYYEDHRADSILW